VAQEDNKNLESTLNDLGPMMFKEPEEKYLEIRKITDQCTKKYSIPINARKHQLLRVTL
jgi:hypothetical protein